MKKNPLVKEQTQNILSQQSPPRLNQNFGLTETEFKAMLQQMQNGEETLFKKVFLAQFENCIKNLMIRYKINRSQAYDATMDALLKFRRRLLTGKISYGNMRFLFNRMASQFLFDAGKHPTILLDESNDNEGDVDGVNEEVLDALDKAWNQLGEECVNLLDGFYYKKIALKILSLRLGKSEAAIRKQKQRCLEKLRQLFLKHYQL